jgi:hypothetical protein
LDVLSLFAAPAGGALVAAFVVVAAFVAGFVVGGAVVGAAVVAGAGVAPAGGPPSGSPGGAGGNDVLEVPSPLNIFWQSGGKS